MLIPTHKGNDTLPRTLGALAQLREPPGGWHFVCVDNASTDCTRETIEAYRNRLPLEYVAEPKLGKPYALKHQYSACAGRFRRVRRR